jgi:hypothetical protein
MLTSEIVEPSIEEEEEQEQDLLASLSQYDEESQISQHSGDSQEAFLATPASNNSSEGRPPELQTARGNSSPIYLHANRGLILEEEATPPRTPSSDALESPIPADEDGMSTAPVGRDETSDASEKEHSVEDDSAFSKSPFEHDDTKDEDETRSDDDVKNDNDEDAWPSDTDPKFLAEAAEYRRRGQVYTGEYRVKRLGRGRLDCGPTLSIAPEAEGLIMGTGGKNVASSSVSVEPGLGYQTLGDSGGDGSRAFDLHTAMGDEGWPLRNEPSLPDVPKDTAINPDGGQVREGDLAFEKQPFYDDDLPYVGEYREGQDKGKGRVSEALSDTESQYAGPVDRGDDWPLRNDSVPYVHESQEGEDKGKDHMSLASTIVQSENLESEHAGSVSKADGWPVRVDPLPHFHRLSEGEASGGQFAADLESEFEGRVTRHDGWPVRLHSLPSFQKLSEASKDERLRKQVLQDVRAQFLRAASMRDSGPVRVDSLPDVRGQQVLLSPLAHSSSANDINRTDLKPWTRVPEVRPSILRKTTESPSSSQRSLLRDRIQKKVHFHFNPSSTSLPAPGLGPPPRPPRPRILSEISRFITRNAAYGLSSAATFVAPGPFVPSAPRSENTISNPTIREQRVQDWLDEQYIITESLGHTTPSTTRPLAKRALKRLHRLFCGKPKTDSQE